jgi:hypothetical protein
MSFPSLAKNALFDMVVILFGGVMFVPMWLVIVLLWNSLLLVIVSLIKSTRG